MKYELTKEEKDNMLGREKFLGYMEDLIKRDMNIYLHEVVLARLKIDPKTFTTSKDFEYIEVEDAIITPKNGIRKG